VKGIGLLAKLLQKARFSDYDLRQELPVVLDELQRAESDPDQALERQAAQRLWGPDWSRKDIGGDSATLQAITIGRLQEAYARYYVPNNAALVVTGDVATEEILAAARLRFGTWQRAPDPFVAHPIPPVAAMTGSSATLVAQPVVHARIAITLRGPSVSQDTTATYAADALCDVLNDPGSAFHQRLVGTGLFQSVSCQYQTLVHVGPISFEGETTPAKTTAALTALLAELDQLGRLEGVTDEDLAIAAQRRRVRRALAVEASSAFAPSLAHWWASGGVGYYEGYGARLDAQGMDDLRRFAQAWVVSRPKVIAVLAPRVVIERIRAQLRAASAPTTP
jgi:zinc protease